MKVAVITGCSSGLGKALARTLHTSRWDSSRTPNRQAYSVVATSRKLADIRDLQSEGIDTLQLDVTDPKSVESAFNQIFQKYGGIDLLVCNAGIYRLGPMLEQEMADVKSVFDTNVFGTLLCVRAAGPIMVKQRYGTIAVVGSIAASMSAPFVGTYCASKAAIHRMFEALRLEMRPYNVDVTIIESGYFRSSLIAKGKSRTEYLTEGSLWARAAKGCQAIADYAEVRPTVTAEQTAVAVAQKLCQNTTVPAYFLVAQDALTTKFVEFLFRYVCPGAISKWLAGLGGVDTKW